ncbi:hypothetical protein [Nocardioides mesophilus]|uniref:Uncharacterized protein n=1 Tax=Nocardioides mesophilus TaxID=433659 RepID=A0A7G9R9V3_9ACTN|nr:hypothetical protein [Nocardioides mesophilus]QNN52378.1 hypothetical protein H9L09_18150 [Nocardioides mesophilus]
MPPRRPRRRALRAVDPLRFAAGWRWVEPGEAAPGPADGAGGGGDAGSEDRIRVDLIRPRDLVALSVTFTGCELWFGGSGPAAVRPRAGQVARMKVEHTFQHGFEEATYEDASTVPSTEPGTGGSPAPDSWPPDPAGSRATPPVGFRPARPSRLVFAVPDGETVEFSTAGILAAMRRLELVLHPLALPGDAPTTGSLGRKPLIVWEPPFLHLGDGLVARLHADGPVIERAGARFLRENPPPDTTTVAGALEQARSVRRARALLASSTPAVGGRTALPEGGLFAPGRGLVPGIIGAIRARRTLSRRPTDDETAVEAPFRLLLSPGPEARFAHAVGPVPAGDADAHVELWHSRLASRPTTEGGPPDEHNRRRRIVRALWTRDRDWVGDSWKDAGLDTQPAINPLSHADPRDPAQAVDPPFLGSLDRSDRNMIVRQTAETWRGDSGPIAPVPVGADALWLSSIGAWLDLHGAWTTRPYSEAGMSSLLAWDHVAPMGRDQYVRVVYPGYLYPFGHQAALVKVTERKMKDVTEPVAALYQRMFLVVGERTRTYADRRLPFTRVDVRPLVSPVIERPGNVTGDSQDTFFWPRVGGQRFAFTLDALDHDDRPVRLHTPLVWVSEAFNSAPQRAAVDTAYAADPSRRVDLSGQKVAFVPSGAGPDPTLESAAVWLLGQAGLGESTPRMSAASVVVPAVQQLSRTGPIAISYFEGYVAGGFGSPAAGEVWAAVNVGGGGEPAQQDPTVPLPQLKFGAGAASGSDKAGGFLSPDLPIRGLSRATGPIGDLDGMVAGTFDPQKFLMGALPKLFGLVSLADLVKLLPDDLAQAPSVLTETLGRIEQLGLDVQRLAAQAQDAVVEAEKLVGRAQEKSAHLQQQAQQALAAAHQVAASADDLVEQFITLLTALAGVDLGDVEAAIAPTFTALDALLADVRALAALLPPQAATVLDRLADGLTEIAAAEDLVQDFFNLVNGFDPSSVQQRFRFEWKPQLQPWPQAAPILELGDGGRDNLVLAVEGRVGGDGTADVTASAEIRDISLLLFPGTPLMRVPFDHLFFKAGTTGKPEVDVVLGEIEFLGLLSFVEVIKDLIPLDGFSDPPFLDVSPAGATAGFTLALPSVAIGVFNLSNMSLGADVDVPFLGRTLTVGFNFCTREQPFTLTVMCLGGGGWFLIRVAPDGLDVLELGLEAGAALAVDFGVASGSISAMIGIYIRLEGEKGSLTGYFRLRGEVDVLGLISASIELYMELLYEFDTGKMVGRATITVEVDVLFFSGSVQVSAERRFAGSNGDPSYREILGAEDGTSPAWDEYCLAFAAD